MTYKLDLNEQDSSEDLVDSCVFNIIDGDELKIEPVNIAINKCKTTVSTKENDNTTVDSISINCDNQTTDIITNNLKVNLNSYQDFKTDNVSIEKLYILKYIICYLLNLYFSF